MFGVDCCRLAHAGCRAILTASARQLCRVIAPIVQALQLRDVQRTLFNKS